MIWHPLKTFHFLSTLHVPRTKRRLQKLATFFEISEAQSDTRGELIKNVLAKGQANAVGSAFARKPDSSLGRWFNGLSSICGRRPKHDIRWSTKSRALFVWRVQDSTQVFKKCSAMLQIVARAVWL